MKYEEMKEQLKKAKKEEALKYLEKLEELGLKKTILQEVAREFLVGNETKAKLKASSFLGIKDDLDPQILNQCVLLHKALLSRIRNTLQAARICFFVGAVLKNSIFFSYSPEEEEVVKKNLEVLESLAQLERFLGIPDDFFGVLLFDSLLLSFYKNPSPEVERCLKEKFPKETFGESVQSLLLELQEERERRRKLELKLMEILRKS